MRKLTTGLAGLVLTLVFASRASAHCEAPRAIYHDEARFNTLAEHSAHRH